MQYKEALDLLLQRLPMFSRMGGKAVKPGLGNITALCAALDNPQQNKKFVHIAGTNGKGSTSHIIAATLQKAGYKTGLYTSPHLVDLRERIRINGTPVSKDFIVDFVRNSLPLMDSIQPSYFELNVAMAFKAFSDEAVDIAVIETGLGGRLDSTNIIMPELSVITNISYDHTDILGNTLAAIAGEKAGIIKDNIPVVIGETQAETESVFFRQALMHQSPILFADSIWDMVKVSDDACSQQFKAVNKASREIFDISTDLLGNYQAANIKTALAASDLLGNAGWNVNSTTCVAALGNVKQATGLRGRWDFVRHHPDVVLDVAHNPAGITLAMDNLERLRQSKKNGRVHIVCGFVKDKDINAALKLMPKDAHYYFTQAATPRAMPAGELAQAGDNTGLHGASFPAVKEAVQAALSAAAPDDIVIITGSFFIVGEAMRGMNIHSE